MRGRFIIYNFIYTDLLLLFFCIPFFALTCLFLLVVVTGSDWPLYIGLAVVGAICVALGAGLARGARKGRRLPPYSIARTGKHKFILKLTH